MMMDYYGGINLVRDSCRIRLNLTVVVELLVALVISFITTGMTMRVRHFLGIRCYKQISLVNDSYSD